ncbi:alpha-E domain-containing protein [Endozoicomonas sp. SM1973]|uniref:Alpha-E domain-containing protein n=1 Tax=Spartinivicinus marinus TaxID=2994442 RepID=A0A853I080_9GAMM|nr:alpha-E domain-containing protein [Spartinivicinus marinus]MCX4026206.1 alpha-E domain-containing protein [Spartinivicinus marinus]NYZ67380.1 alpha-E domain-containing protein [Spartinivicinus marinus]
MLSRVAETLYWMARYVERAENIARLVNVNNLLLMDLPKGVSPGWEPLIDIIGTRELFRDLYDDFSENSVLEYLIIEKNNPSSILSALLNARDNTRTVREVIPRQVWEAINSSYYFVKENAQGALSKRGRFFFMKHVVESAHLIFGALDATLNHNLGYTFIRFGSLLERADMTSRIIDVRSARLIHNQTSRPFENIQWMSVLRSLSAYQMYRQQMGVRVRPREVLQFMLQDNMFPRSVLFCLNTLRRLTEDMPNNVDMVDRIEHSINELRAQNAAKLKDTNILHLYIDELQIDLADIHQQLSEQYFLH